jgi:hypothetical protein
VRAQEAPDGWLKREIDNHDMVSDKADETCDISAKSGCPRAWNVRIERNTTVHVNM